MELIENIFNFETPNTEYIYNIDSQTILHIKRVNHAVALLYFTDLINNKINIPNDILVYTFDYENNNKVLLQPIKQDFALCWTDDYIINFNDKIITIKNQRNWIIS